MGEYQFYSIFKVSIKTTAYGLILMESLNHVILWPESVTMTESKGSNYVFVCTIRVELAGYQWPHSHKTHEFVGSCFLSNVMS